MRFWIKFTLAATLLFALAAGAPAAEDAQNSIEPPQREGRPQGKEKPGFAIETTSADLSGPLGGVTTEYTVTAGLIPILDAEGTEKAQIFSTAYTIKAAEGEKRPVAFIFNGGPGSSSVYLHMGGLAPKTVSAIPNKGLGEPVHPYRVTDNPQSPLAVADLVFVDPVGTGFSRSVGKREKDKDKKDADENSPLSPYNANANAGFWSAVRDLETLAELIRTWLTQNNRWGSRIFLIGESYGGFRAAGLPFYLSKLGIATSGTAMISPVIDYKYVMQTNVDFESDVNALPTAAAIARYHGLLAEDLQKMPENELTDMVWKWARTEYRQAFYEGNRLSEERFKALTKELSRMTSLPEVEFIDQGLRFPDNFPYLVLRGRRLRVSPYDGRMTAPSAFRVRREEDPLQRVANEYYYTALMDFLRGTVGVETLRPYLASSYAVFANWQFLNGRMGIPGNADTLAAQMRRFPSLKVFLAMGRYDMVCPPESALAALDTMDVPKDRLVNIETRMYDGGHMMYTNPEAARKLCEDLSAWISATASP